MVPQHLQLVQPHTSRWLEEEISLASNLKGLGLFENGHVMKPSLQEAVSISSYVSLPFPIQQSMGAADANIFPVGLRKSPAGRPTGHLGPPPSFNPVPTKQVSFPFPGKQVPSMPLQMEKQNDNRCTNKTIRGSHLRIIVWCRGQFLLQSISLALKFFNVSITFVFFLPDFDQDQDYDVVALANNLSQAFHYGVYNNGDIEEVHGSAEPDDKDEILLKVKLPMQK
ncbi:hypothetical protein VNO77_19257 [Canavalia gladiata]|uniref:Uncharacterized protein n=1 Tax=Canavalia gladiata TaxID=3824 RepID=A0AAN9LM35_CANGL